MPVPKHAMVEERGSRVQDDDVDVVSPKRSHECRGEFGGVSEEGVRNDGRRRVDVHGDIDIAMCRGVPARLGAEEVGFEDFRTLEQRSP